MPHIVIMQLAGAIPSGIDQKIQMSYPGSGVNQRDYALSWEFLVSYDWVARLGQGGSNPWIQVFYGFHQTRLQPMAFI